LIVAPLPQVVRNVGAIALAGRRDIFEVELLALDEV
jgi:hypothetical protein